MNETLVYKHLLLHLLNHLLLPENLLVELMSLFWSQGCKRIHANAAERGGSNERWLGHLHRDHLRLGLLNPDLRLSMD